MYSFPSDWIQLIEFLEKWSALSVRDRRLCLSLKTQSGKSKRKKQNRRYAELIDAGFLIQNSPGKPEIREDLKPYFNTLSNMEDIPLFDGKADKNLLSTYLDTHFSYAQKRALSSGLKSNYGGFGTDILMRELANPQRLYDFLETRTPSEWESRYSRCEIEFFDTEELFGMTQTIVRRCMEKQNPMPVGPICKLFPDKGTVQIAKAVSAGVYYALLFLTLRASDLEPRIGIWPSIFHRARRSKPVKPRQINPETQFSSSVLMEDMTHVAVHACLEPLRIKLDGNGVYQRDAKQLEPGLPPIPAWFEGFFDSPAPGRIETAIQFLHLLHLIEYKGVPGKDRRIETSGEGRRWLDLSGNERNIYVLDHVRRHNEKRMTFEDVDSGDLPADYLNPYPPMRSIGLDKELRGWIINAFKNLPLNVFYKIDSFMYHEKLQNNPLLKIGRPENLIQIYIKNSLIPPDQEDLENIWESLLYRFLGGFLVYMGGASAGLLKDGSLAFALTDLSRYLFASVEQPCPVEDQTPAVLIQPDFEVIFLSPSPGSERRIGRFAERIGYRVGAMFKITKPSIFQAAGAGLTREDVLKTLEQTALGPIPANVKREITGWFEQFKCVRIESGDHIRCDDRTTTQLILSAFGDYFKPVSSCILRMRDTAHKKHIAQKLMGLGVFVKTE